MDSLIFRLSRVLAASLVGPVQQVGELVEGLVLLMTGERAVRALEAVAEEGPEGHLEAARLGSVQLEQGQRGIDGAVEDQGAHFLGKQVRVHGAQVGAVRLPQVGQPGVSESRPLITSMSRAASAVPTWGRSFADLASHAAANFCPPLQGLGLGG